MRSFYFFSQLSIIIAFFAIVGGKTVIDHTDNDKLASALMEIQQSFHQELNQLQQDIFHFQQLTADNSTSTHRLREQHLQVRTTFKRCQYLLEYIDPKAIRRFINGAPLPKTEAGVPEIQVIEPSGLQVLDELVFADELNRPEIRKMADKLAAKYQDISTYAKNRRLNHRHVFEAIRYELVRIMTLGVTGFDTPGSVAALSEGVASMQTLQKAYLNYSSTVHQHNPAMDAQIKADFTGAITQLAAGDFDTFDRLSFLRDYINPLTASITEVQNLLGVEFTENTYLPTPHNFRGKQLFDANWLNTDFYAQLSPSAYDEERIALGRLLFFDPILSSSNTLSCASCHHPDQAFTDGKKTSLTSEEKNTIFRNSPTLINSVYAEKYFYDLREEKLARQIHHVVVDKMEFATDFVTITQKLAKSPAYKSLFEAAYADHPQYAISQWSISNALAEYVASLRTHNSTFDQMARGEIAVDPIVALGFNVFMGKGACGTCHFAPTFNGLVPPLYVESESEVLGVPATTVWENAEIDPDPGRIASQRPQDEVYFNAYAFKTPTVRNVALTAPYMHNGVYTTLEEVIKFYHLGGGAGIGIELDHQTLPFDELALADEEITAMVKFMEALTDTVGLNQIPAQLPIFPDHPERNQRQVGGTY